MTPAATRIVRIFVSSTWLDLQPERHAVEDAIQRTRFGKFVGMEYFGSRSETTKETSLAEVDKSDLYLGIIGGRYGSGITEAEYRRACASNPPLPCFIYFKSETAIPLEGRDNDPAKAAQLSAFKEALRRQHIIAEPFSTPVALAVCVRDDLHRWFFDTILSAQLTAQAPATITTEREDHRHVRLELGAVYGSVVYDGHPVQPRPRTTPLRPSVRPMRGLLDRTTETAAALQALQSLLPVELYGAAGSGKTALLRHLAYHIPTAQLPDGAIYVEQVGHQPATDLLQFLFDSFYESTPTYKPREAELLNWLRDKRALVLLDDVATNRTELDRVLNALPETAVLWSAQERHLFGEGCALLVAGLPEKEALELFARELGRSLTPAEQEAAQSICVLLRGHPLHLAQAAGLARDQQQSLAQVAASLQASAAPATALNEQLIATCSEKEKRVLAMLAALPGAPVLGGTLATLADVPELEATVTNLAEHKLLAPCGPQGQSYRLTDAVQTLLPQQWDLTEWRERALSHYFAWAETQPAPEVLQNELPAIRSLFHWTTETGRHADTIQLGKLLESSLIQSGQWESWGQVLQAIGQAAQASGDRATEAWVLHEQGTRALCLSNNASAQALLTEALERRIALGDHVAASVTRHNLDWLIPPVPFVPSHTPAELDSPPQPFPKKRRVPGLLKFFGGALLAGLSLLLLWPYIKAQPRLLFAPNELPFGNQAIGGPSTERTVSLLNPRAQLLKITSLDIIGNNSNDFQIVKEDCRNRQLAQNESCQISFTFVPQQPGLKNARAILRDTAGTELPSLPLLGTAIAPTPTPTVAVSPTPSPTATATTTSSPIVTPPPSSPSPVSKLSSTPGSLTFGSLEIGKIGLTQQIRLTNEGSAFLQLAKITIQGEAERDFAIKENACGTRLTAKGFCLLELTFTPHVVGERRAVLRISNEADATILTVPLSGQGLQPPPARLLVTPLQLGFGEQRLGAITRPGAITISNGGASPLTVSQISFANEQQRDFSIRSNSCANRTLSQNENCVVQVLFSPQTPGPRTASLTVTTNAGRQAVGLSGTGASPLPALLVSPDPLDFGEQEPREGGIEKTITLASSNAAPVQIGAISLSRSPVFFLANNSCSNTTLTQRQTCQIRVRFVPRNAQEQQATLTIQSDAPNSPHLISIRGRGLVRARPRLLVRPARLDFQQGSNTRGGAQQITLQTDGTGELSLRGLTITGNDAQDFSLRSSCADRTLTAQDRCTASVIFAPRPASRRAANRARESVATLLITHDGVGEQTEVPLRGTIAPPTPSERFSLTPGNLNFGQQSVGTRGQSQLVTLTNEGDIAFDAPRVSVTDSFLGSLVSGISGGAVTPNANGHFVLTGNTCNQRLNPGESCRLSVTFAPRSSGQKNGSLTVFVGQLNRSTSLRGEGISREPERKGYCCLGGRVIDLSPEECKARRGQSYPDERTAQQRCQTILR